jgi:2-hydroxy-3-keto-5-methylthiopentenyl-1-phosphate phosphatase
MTTTGNTLIQSDFDDTITYKDVSLILLDKFAGPEWREMWDSYQAGRMTLGAFNERAFGMVKAGRQEMLHFIKGRFAIRPGFSQFVRHCRENGLRFVIVSNGLDFYIREILEGLGLGDVEFHAAETVFDPAGLKVRYVSHDGSVVDRDFKLGYTKKFISEGYQITYIGDGTSDIGPARLCDRVFATQSLLRHCQTNNIACSPFEDFNDILTALRSG